MKQTFVPKYVMSGMFSLAASLLTKADVSAMFPAAQREAVATAKNLVVKLLHLMAMKEKYSYSDKE